MFPVKMDHLKLIVMFNLFLDGQGLFLVKLLFEYTFV